MCFGERTTFVCSIDGCTNKHWETKYYAFGPDSDSGKCDAGNVLGTCANPWMVYHQEETMCRECYTRWTEETPSPSPTPETWHPQDHDHSLPILPSYEEFEKATIETGEFTGPMIVARELNRQARDGDTTVSQQNVPEHQLLDQIRDIIRRRNVDGLAPEESVNTPNASDPTEATTNVDDVLPPPPITPVRALSRSEIPAAVFEGPLPKALPNNMPLPAYDQVASRGRAPNYSENDLMDIPVNLQTLKRLSDYCYYLGIALSDDLQNQLVKTIDYACIAITMPEQYPADKMQKIADAAEYLEEGMVRLCNKAGDRRKIVFQYNTTSATEHQVAEWIAEITRNPENSVRSHARRFTEWIWLLEYELVFGILPDDSPDNFKLPDGSRYPNCQQINRIFEQKKVRDQRIMQGEDWDETSGTFVEASDTDRLLIADIKRRDKEIPSAYRTNDHYGDQDKPSWRDGFGGPIHADSRRFICVPTAFGVPNPRPLPGPNDPMEVVEIDTDQPREVIDLTGDSPDAMEID
ncbi:hypothetical protein KCU95_g2577, partial [Aureobasidium melanogenum]